MRTDISVIIITYNEESNIGFALKSVCGWAKNVFVVDSFSSDGTVGVCKTYDCDVVQNPFVTEFSQRNWTLTNLPITSEWIFFLDADEWMPSQLKDEIDEVIQRSPEENGFMLRWRFIWMGKWVKRGYYPKWLTRLVRRDKARWEIRHINPHLVVDGPTGRVKHDFIHENRKGLRDWSEKHVRYALREAEELVAVQMDSQNLTARLFGSQAQRVRWIRLNVYNRLPIIFRASCYFIYRAAIRGGFLDGWQALVFHFLHAFWCPLLIDLFYLELRDKTPRIGSTLRSAYGACCNDTRQHQHTTL